MGPEEIRKNIVNGHELALWTEEHGALQEKDFLVAVKLILEPHPSTP